MDSAGWTHSGISVVSSHDDNIMVDVLDALRALLKLSFGACIQVSNSCSWHIWSTSSAVLKMCDTLSYRLCLSVG